MGPPNQLYDQFKEWLSRHWVHKAACVWLFLVFIDGAILFMVMTGMLSSPNELLDPDEREDWGEVTSQIMNGLFSIAAFYNHPIRIQHTYYFFTDINRLRTIKGEPGLAKHDLANILFFLHLNCFTQYVVAFFMWHYNMDNRPAWGVPIFLVISFASGITGGVLESRAKKRAQQVTGGAPSSSSSPSGGDLTLETELVSMNNYVNIA